MCIVWAVLPLSPTAHAGPEILDEIGWLPADVDFVLAVRDMNKVRQMPLGKGVTALVKTGLQVGANESDTLGAWRSLSEQLGFTEEEAFNALLGERFFCASRERPGGESDWVMYSKTSLKIARVIRQKLDVAPREIKHDRVLMSLEGGAFRLGSMIDGDHAWLMLAPTSQDGLFRQIADNEGAPGWIELGDTIPMQELRTLGDGELAVYMTFDGRADHGWFGLVAVAQHDSIGFRMLSQPGAELPPIEPWSTAMFDEFRDGALFAHVERMPIVDKDADDEPLPNGGIAEMLADLRKLLEIPRKMLGEDLALILGNRFALAVHAKPGGGISLGAGMEASDVKALATPGDAAMRSIIESIRLFYGAQETGFNFVGRLPRAVRSIRLEPSKPGQGHGHQFGAGLPPFGGLLDFKWSYRDTLGQAPTGWWVVGTDSRAFERAAQSLTIGADPNDDGVTAPWLILLDAHPAAMLEALVDGGMPRPESPTGIESVEAIWLRTWIDDGGASLVVGEGAIRITEPRDPRKGRRLRGR